MNVLSIILPLWSLCSPNSSHSKCGNASDLPNAEHTSRADSRRLGFEAWQFGRYTEAARYYEQVVNREGNERQAITTGDLHLLSLIYVALGRFDDARNLFYQILNKLARTGVAGIPDAAKSYLLLGEVLQMQGKFSEAEAAFKEAVALPERYRLQEDVQFAGALNSLGLFYVITGQSSEAERLLQRAWQIADKVLSPDSTELLVFLDSHASILCRKGRFAEAEKYWTRAFAIVQTGQGPRSRYGAVATHLGEFYTAIGEYKSAEAFLKLSLAAYDDTFTVSSVTLAVILGELANVYTKTKRYPEAESLLARSMKIVEENAGFVPLGDALVYSCAGYYYFIRHDWIAAERHYRRAVELRKSVLGEHPLVASSLRSLSEALRKLNRKKEAKELLARAYQIVAAKESIHTAATIDVRAFHTK